MMNFDLSTEQFRVQSATMQRLIGLDAVTPHCLRHAGAAAMLEQDPTALQLVKRRGRWSSDRSLKRYTKTHILVALRGNLPPALLTLGQLFIANPESELARARANDLSARS